MHNFIIVTDFVNRILLQVHPVAQGMSWRQIISICTSLQVVKETKWPQPLPYQNCAGKVLWLRQIDCVQRAITTLSLECVVIFGPALKMLRGLPMVWAAGGIDCGSAIKYVVNQCIIAACVLEVYFEGIAYQCAPITVVLCPLISIRTEKRYTLPPIQ